MAVARQAPICPRCNKPYDGLYADRGKHFVGDTFIMWDIERHVCKDEEESVLSRYEERLERIIETLKCITTLEGIGLLSKHIPKLPSEE